MSGFGNTIGSGLTWSLGNFGYQFITTGSEIETDSNGCYKGSAVYVSLPENLIRLSTVTLKGIATGSTLESYGEPEIAPTADLNKIAKVHNIAQIQLVPESRYYGYSLDGSVFTQCSSLAYASVCPQGRIYNAGIYMLADYFNMSDAAFDLAPTKIMGGINPLGRMPEADWPNEACRVKVVSEEYGTRYFIVMVDASCIFYCWPDQYSSKEYLEPPDSSYIEQQYKANIPSDQVQSVIPDFPVWTYVPVGQRRDTDWPVTVNSGEPRYGWRFHPLGTKVVGTVLRREEWTGSIWATRGQYNIFLSVRGDNRDTIYDAGGSVSTITLNYFLLTRVLRLKLEVDDIIWIQYKNDYYYKITDAVDELLTGSSTIELSVSLLHVQAVAGNPTPLNNFWYWGHVKECEVGDFEIDPSVKDTRYNGEVTTLHNDSPGWCEFSLDIAITGTEKEDFTFSMELLDSEVADDSAYPIAAGYCSPVGNAAFTGYGELSVTPGDLIVAYLESYDDALSRRQAMLCYGYEGNTNDFVRRSQITIKNYTQESELFTFLTRWNPPDYKHMRNLDPVLSQDISSTYFPFNTLEGKLLEFDLETLSFVYQATVSQYTFDDTAVDVDYASNENFYVWPFIYGSSITDMRLCQIWKTQQTGVRVYHYGAIVNETVSGSALDLWDSLDVALVETGLDRILLSKTATRYLQTEFTGLQYFNFFKYCLQSMTANSYSRLPTAQTTAFIMSNFLPSVTTNNAHDKFVNIYPTVDGLGNYEEFDISALFDTLYYTYHWKSYLQYQNLNKEGVTSNILVGLYGSGFTGNENDYINEETVEDYLSQCHQDYDAFHFDVYDDESETTGVASIYLNQITQYLNYIIDIGGVSFPEFSYYYYFSIWIISAMGTLLNDLSLMKHRGMVVNSGGYANPSQRLYGYTLGHEWLMNEWVFSCPPGPKTRTTNDPNGYYGAYFKYPSLVEPTPENRLFFHSTLDFQMAVDDYSNPLVDTYYPVCVNKPNWDNSNLPSATDVEFVTVDYIGHPDFPGIESTHQAFYEQAFEKEDGSIADPAVSVVSEFGKYYYKISLDGTSTALFVDNLNTVKLPRLNGAALFSKF